MKKHLFVSAAFLCVVIAGCSQMRMKSENSVVGTWTAMHDSGLEVIFEFKPGMKMACTVPDAPEYSFVADYTFDPSKKPATVDLKNIDPATIQSVCLAIVKFSGNDTMEFHGLFGEPGQVSRPAKIEPYTELPELYLKFTKKTD